MEGRGEARRGEERKRGRKDRREEGGKDSSLHWSGRSQQFVYVELNVSIFT